MQFSLAQVETEDALWRGRDDKKAIGGGDECTPREHPARYKKMRILVAAAEKK